MVINVLFFWAVGLFLAINGYRLRATQVEATLTMQLVATGEMDEAAFATWIRKHMQTYWCPACDIFICKLKQQPSGISSDFWSLDWYGKWGRSQYHHNLVVHTAATNFKDNKKET